ncbi:MAG: Hsp33 family molecular chaperone [Variibacter sp.]
MNEPQIPERAPAQAAVDDSILPFQVDALDLRGRVLRLGPAVDEILTGHGYPAPVTKLLGQAVALGVLLATSLKFDGRFILQTQTDGPVRMLIVDFMSPGGVRACARFDKERVAAAIAAGTVDDQTLLGKGHLAMTIDQGGARSRYQGLVAIEEGGLEAAAHEYFHRSEQIPTRLRLAVAEDFQKGPEGLRRHWRAGGILLQFLPKSEARQRQADLDPGDAPEGTARHQVAEDDAWVEGRSLIETVEDIELLDPTLSSERLAYRLFHERGVRVFKEHKIVARCSCSRDKITDMLQRFSDADRNDMVENGVISVTCEFCNRTYVVEPSEVQPQEAAQGEARQNDARQDAPAGRSRGAAKG